MFCEKCGTRVDDGQPFCPNCGNRLSAPAAPAAPEAQPAPAANTASVNPGLNNIPVTPVFTASAAPKQPLKLPALGGLTDKFNSLEGLGQIFYGCTGILLLVCFILSLLRVFSLGGYGSAPMAGGSIFFANVLTVLFTLCITFYLQDAFGKFSFKWLWFFIAGAAALILLIFIIMWIDSGCSLTVGGWFFFIFQIALTALAILFLLEQLKKK